MLVLFRISEVIYGKERATIEVQWIQDAKEHNPECSKRKPISLPSTSLYWTTLLFHHWYTLCEGEKNNSLSMIKSRYLSWEVEIMEC